MPFGRWQRRGDEGGGPGASGLRRLRHRRLALATAGVVVVLAGAGVAVGASDTDAPVVSCEKLRLAHANPSGQPCARHVAVASPASAAPFRPPIARPDPWLAYLTDVDPGGAIQFVSTTTGYRVTGQGPAPHLDGHLAAGPAGAAAQWPGSAVTKTTDGGATWKQVTGVRNGVWGIDFVTAKLGWVVGVTSLTATDDGGVSWRPLAEPASHPLVAVQFASPTTGFGLDTDGQLYRSVDGGAHWQRSPIAVHATSLCFSSGEAGYVADQSGDVLQTSNQGASWTQSYRSPVQPAFRPVWSQLSCAGADVWQTIRVITPVIPDLQPYLVANRSASSGSWSTLASNVAGAGASAAQIRSTATPLAAVQAVAASSGRAYLAGIPLRGLAVGVSVAQAKRGEAPPPAVAPLPANPKLNQLTTTPGQYLQIEGVSAAGSRVWMDVVDNAVGSEDAPRFATVVLSSEDGGSSWSVVNDSGPAAPPPYSP